MGIKRRNAAAGRLQQYIKGHLARKRVIQMYKDQIIKENANYLDEFVMKKAYDDSQFAIAYFYKKYAIRKEKKKQKKKEEEEKKKNRFAPKAKKKPAAHSNTTMQ